MKKPPPIVQSPTGVYVKVPLAPDLVEAVARYHATGLELASVFAQALAAVDGVVSRVQSAAKDAEKDVKRLRARRRRKRKR